MNNEKYGFYLGEVRKILTAPGKLLLPSPKSAYCWCSTIGTPHRYITVGDPDRSLFHLRLAFLTGWLIHGCSSVSNPFIEGKIHRIFPFIRFTHSHGYASAGDHPNCFASLSLNSDPFMQYAG